MRYSGEKLGVKDWVDKSDKMLNLALAAPTDHGACPTTFSSRDKTWKGCLITPKPECYYDLPSIAWKGVWLLRFAQDFKDCPRRDEIMATCREMAALFVRFQKPNGSVPSWLSKDFKVVPVLEECAQTALPIWFLTELAKCEPTRADAWKGPIDRGARFLADSVVDGNYWYDFETFFSCSPKQCFENDHAKMRDPHTWMPPQNTLCMQWTAEALRGAFHLTRERRFMDQSLKALDAMCMYQAVWPVPWLSVANVYGSFGVQNSDGEYNDARQAQFGATLCDFGAELGREDYFERGVAATRASLALINDPLHEQLGIYPHPNYPLGLEPENCGHGGTNEQDGRTGFDWGEGSGLTSMAWLVSRYGDAYVDDAGHWKVGVNGVVFSPDGSKLGSPMPHSNPTAVEVVRNGGPRAPQPVERMPRVEGGLTVSPAIMDRPNDSIDIAVSVAPWGSVKDATFKLADGRVVPAQTLEDAKGTGALLARVRAVDLSGPVTVSARVGEWTLQAGPFYVPVDPTFDFSDPSLPGWMVDGDFAQIPSRSKRFDFNAGNHAFIGTCEDGRGGYDDSYTGTITSPEFVVTKPNIKLLVGGGSLEEVYVELLDPAGARVYVERGHDRESMDERTWDVRRFYGKRLRIRIVDPAKSGWGHINVGLIRCVD